MSSCTVLFGSVFFFFNPFLTKPGPVSNGELPVSCYHLPNFLHFSLLDHTRFIIQGAGRTNMIRHAVKNVTDTVSMGMICFHYQMLFALSNGTQLRCV